MRVAGAGAGVHDTRPPLIQCELPTVIEQRRHIADRDVVGWVEPVCPRLLDVYIGMVDDQEMSTRSDRSDQPTFRLMVRRLQEGWVLGRDEVEPRTREFRIEQAGVDPVDLRVGLLGGRGCTLQRDVGHVDRRDPPTSPCQPDGVGPFAASDVEGGAWIQVAHFGDEGTVRFTTPHLFGACVPCVPIGVTLTETFEVRVMPTSEVVMVRLGIIAQVGHRPRVCPGGPPGGLRPFPCPDVPEGDPLPTIAGRWSGCSWATSFRPIGTATELPLRALRFEAQSLGEAPSDRSPKEGDQRKGR